MTNPRRPLVVLASLLLFAGAVCAARAVPLPSGIHQVTSVEGISEYRHDNGLRILLFPDSSKQTATVNVTYLVGSRHEGYGETGMAHLLEHMVFKGTTRHPNIPQELTSHGARPNGSTWFDRTNYFETFAATDENLDWALDLEADRMVHSLIRAEDLASEFSVVRNEFEMGENSPAAVLEERILSTAYIWHNYGKSTIGSREDIERVPVENLRAFYRLWYQPDNAVLVVAGRFDEARTLRRIAETFGAIPKPDRQLPVTWTVEPPQDGERTVTLRRVGDVQMVGAAYHVPAAAHEDFAAVDVLAFLLADTPSGRLHEALVETRKAASVGGYAMPLHDPGFLSLRAEVRAGGSLDEARELFIDTVEGFAATAPTEAEVSRAREARLKAWETTMRNSERAAIELSEWAALGDWRLMFVYRDRVAKVTPADVTRVAATYLRPSNRTAGVYVPTRQAERTAVPPGPDVAALVAEYKGQAALAAGETFDPAPAAIEARLLRHELAPGIDLVLLPKKTRGATVNAALTFHLGDEASLQGRRPAGELAAAMLMRGTTERNREGIQDEADRLRTQLAVYGDATAVNVGLETTAEHLAGALRLAAEVLRRPAFTADELELLREERLAALEEAKSDPRQRAFVRLDQHLHPWPATDPRYAASPEEEIPLVAAVTAADVRRFWEQFHGASAAEIAVVGDFDPAAVKALVEELFGGWTSQTAPVRLAARWAERPVLRETIETPDKESAVFVAGLRLPLRDDDPDYPALVLGNWMTGGGFLNSRISTRLRQKDGLSYGAGSFFNASAFDPEAQFGSYAIYAPQNGEKLVAAYQEEMARVVAEEFSATEIADAKSGWRQRQNVSRSTDRELARLLAARAYQDRTLAWDAELERRVAELDGAQILAALRAHLDPARLSWTLAGDFARARAAAADSAAAAPAAPAAPATP